MGNETKHTPGPWKLVKTGDDFDPLAIRMGTALKTPHHCRVIHRIEVDWDLERGSPDYAEGMANLRLMVAAPKLLDALREFIEAFVVDNTAMNEWQQKVVIQADAAIAKAVAP